MEKTIAIQMQELREAIAKKIESQKVPQKDDWSDGLNTGIDWALRVLRGDKSAT